MLTNATAAANVTGAPDVFPRALEVVYFCVGLPLGVAVCLGNAVLLSVVVPRYQGPLRDSTRVLLASLALCDVAAGLLFTLHVTLLPFQGDVRAASREGCLLLALLMTVPVMANFLHLTLICGERNLFVCRPASVVTRRKATLACACMWTYSVLLALAGMFSLLARRHGDAGDDVTTGRVAWALCDVLTLPGYYLLVVGLHVAATLGANAYFAVSIKGTLQLHQRKIQVTNTITYHNLVEDTRVAWLFFLAYALQLGPWLPLAVMLAVLAAGVHTPAVFVLARVCYLVAQIPGLKFLLFLWRNKELQKAARKRLGCVKKPPRPSPTHTQ